MIPCAFIRFSSTTDFVHLARRIAERFHSNCILFVSSRYLNSKRGNDQLCSKGKAAQHGCLVHEHFALLSLSLLLSLSPVPLRSENDAPHPAEWSCPTVRRRNAGKGQSFWQSNRSQHPGASLGQKTVRRKCNRVPFQGNSSRWTLLGHRNDHLQALGQCSDVPLPLRSWP